jgi:hypothetical protein
MELLSVLLDPSPEGRELPPAPKQPPVEQAPGELQMFLRGLAGLPRQPLRAGRVATHASATRRCGHAPHGSGDRANVEAVPQPRPGGPRRWRHLGASAGPCPADGAQPANLPIDGSRSLIAFTWSSRLGVTVNEVVGTLCVGPQRDEAVGDQRRDRRRRGRDGRGAEVRRPPRGHQRVHPAPMTPRASASSTATRSWACAGSRTRSRSSTTSSCRPRT